MCITCDASCKKCTDTSATGCTECYSGKYLLASNNSCVACNSGSYVIEGLNCVTCDSSCKTCSAGNSPISCLTCYSGKYLLASNNSCVTCNSGNYGPEGLNCVLCHSSCQTCSAGNSATGCLTCYTGKYLFAANNSCVDCNSGNYGPEGQYCVPCDSSCQTCSAGNSPTSCLTCPTGKYLLTSNNSCVACNSGNYGPEGSHCVLCDSSCQTCSAGNSPTSCLTCYPGKYLLTSNNSCVDCNSGNYGPEGQYCVLCDSTCQTCSAGNSPTDCLTCYSGTYLLASNNSCVACNSGNYGPEGQYCVLCDSTCQTCSAGNSPTDCLTCYSGTYLLTSNNSCVACNSGSYVIQGQYCVPCDSTCQTCSAGYPPTSCLTCYSGKYLLTSNNSCVACNSGSYAPSSLYCVPCDSTCRTCSVGNSPTACTSCNSGYSLRPENNTCLPVVRDLSLELEATAAATSKTGATTAIAVTSALSGQFSISLMLLLTVIDAIANMQYLNMNHSQTALNLYDILSTELLPNWITQLYDGEAVVDWGIFKTKQTSYLYLDNLGDTLEVISIYLLLTLLTFAASYILQSNKMFERFFRRMHVYFLGLLGSNVFGKIQSLILFAILQSFKFAVFNDAYHVISVIVGYLTTSSIIGFTLYTFLKTLTVYRNNQKKIQKIIQEKPSIERRRNYQRKAMRKPENMDEDEKYGFIFEDYNMKSKNTFLFNYWTMTYNSIYILLILSLQSNAIAQCSSIVGLTIIFIIFSAVLRPFKEPSSTFLHYFNLTCILAVAITNLFLAIALEVNPDFEGAENQGMAIFIFVIINFGINTIVPLFLTGRMIFLACYKRKGSAAIETRQRSPRNTTRRIDSSNSKVQTQNFFPEEASRAASADQDGVNSTTSFVQSNKQFNTRKHGTSRRYLSKQGEFQHHSRTSENRRQVSSTRVDLTPSTLMPVRKYSSNSRRILILKKERSEQTKRREMFFQKATTQN